MRLDAQSHAGESWSGWFSVAPRYASFARAASALMVEAWSGVRSMQSAAEAMGVVLTRFYQLEARALQLIVSGDGVREAASSRPSLAGCGSRSAAA